VLGCPAHFALLLYELLSGNLALGALLGSGIAFMNITANAANELLHNLFPPQMSLMFDASELSIALIYYITNCLQMKTHFQNFF
jgi:hypothetical protein